jgi:hypothetical protein
VVALAAARTACAGGCLETWRRIDQCRRAVRADSLTIGWTLLAAGALAMCHLCSATRASADEAADPLHRFYERRMSIATIELSLVITDQTTGREETRDYATDFINWRIDKRSNSVGLTLRQSDNAEPLASTADFETRIVSTPDQSFLYLPHLLQTAAGTQGRPALQRLDDPRSEIITRQMIDPRLIGLSPSSCHAWYFATLERTYENYLQRERSLAPVDPLTGLQTLTLTNATGRTIRLIFDGPRDGELVETSIESRQADGTLRRERQRIELQAWDSTFGWYPRRLSYELQRGDTIVQRQEVLITALAINRAIDPHKFTIQGVGTPINHPVVGLPATAEDPAGLGRWDGTQVVPLVSTPGPIAQGDRSPLGGAFRWLLLFGPVVVLAGWGLWRAGYSRHASPPAAAPAGVKDDTQPES